MNNIGLWSLASSKKPRVLVLPDMSSLDAITRQLPTGFYSTFRTFRQGRAVLDLQAHLDRLYQPAHHFGLVPSVNVDILRRTLDSLLETYRPAEARLRLMLTQADQAGTVYVAIEPLKLLVPEVYAQGVRVVTVHVQRTSPRLKSTAFIGQSDAERKALAAQHVFEGLIVREGKILEGLTSNFFYVLNPTGTTPGVGTARNGILLGVTRREVIRVARKAGYQIAYQPLNVKEIGKISEAFITSSSRGIVPVVTIDEVGIGSGNVGPVTGRLIRLYDEWVEQKAEAIAPASGG